jgi:hypothetical protein
MDDAPRPIVEKQVSWPARCLSAGNHSFGVSAFSAEPEDESHKGVDMSVLRNGIAKAIVEKIERQGWTVAVNAVTHIPAGRSRVEWTPGVELIAAKEGESKGYAVRAWGFNGEEAEMEAAGVLATHLGVRFCEDPEPSSTPPEQHFPPCQSPAIPAGLEPATFSFGG